MRSHPSEEENPRVPIRPTGPPHGHLPRLERPRYQGFAVVFWTLTLEERAKGWLTDQFHARFREWMLHAAARDGLFCPVYCLMPDHAHLVWMGMRVDTDQRDVMRFLSTEFNRGLRSRPGAPTHSGFRLQHQPHDHLLRAHERERSGITGICHYILQNPVRAGLVESGGDYPHSGAVVPGYPVLRPCEGGFWGLFWRLYEQHRESDPPGPPSLAS